MCDLCRLISGLVVDLFRSRAALEAEVLVLKQQIIVLRRGKPNRMSFLAVDRFILGWVCRLFPKAHDAVAIVRPDTVVRWHRAGFRLFWRWKSRRGLGRPAVPPEIRQLIREMSIANPLWGAPRIHGELLRLGIDVGQTSVAKYMVRRRRPPKYVGFVGPMAAAGGARITTVVTMATRTTRDATIGTVVIGSDSRGGANNSAPFAFFDAVILLPPRVRKFKSTNYELGWTDGGNVRIDTRWGADDVESERRYASELVALAPDIVLARYPQRDGVAACRQYHAYRVRWRHRPGRCRIRR